jgi:serine/threonine protein kinase
MDADRFRRIRDWFDVLRDVDPKVRTARLIAEEPDADIRARVMSLLGHDTIGAVQDHPAISGLLGAMADDTPQVGTALGAWTLVRIIGQGGMGTVFEARRSDGHFDQTAALKVMNGLPSATALALLAQERQILAGLEHPNIARLLDGGATAGGQPWFVMALQDGVPIDLWCTKRSLDSADVVKLMLPVCSAMAYAHARLVIHCDLKPANILVDADGRPCVLDFGIARSVAPTLAGQESKSSHPRAYTPGFASPELETGDSVGTATDIYSLGRTLESLLGAERLAREEALASVVRCATAVDLNDRYRSIAEFTADLTAWLEHRPVSSMPPSVAYRSRLWWRRHWPAATGALAFVLLGIVFTWNTIRERDRARAAEVAATQERDRARLAESRAQEISDFLVSMLEGSNPDAGSGDVPVGKLVQEALVRIDSELAGQTELQAELYGTLARVMKLIGNDAESLKTIDKAIALSRQLNRPVLLGEQLAQLTRLRLAAYDSAGALAPARESVALLEAQPDADPATRLVAKLNLGIILSETGDAEGTTLLQQVVAEQRSVNADSEAMAEALMALAANRVLNDDLPAAEKLQREAVAIRTQFASGDVERLLGTREMLARTLSDLNRVDEAETILRASLVERRRIHGDDDPTVAWHLTGLARVLDNHGRSLDALPVYAQALQIAERKLGADSPSYAVMLNGQAMALHRSGDYARAHRDFERATEIGVVRWGEAGNGMARLRFNHARLYLDEGRLVEAKRLVERAESTWANLRDASHGELNGARAVLALIACEQNDATAAASQLAAVRTAVPAPDGELRRWLARADACMASRAGDDSAVLGHLLSAEEADAESLSPGNPQIALGRLARAEWLAKRNRPGDRDAATALARGILEAVDKHLVAAAPQRQRLLDLIEH